MEIVLAGLGRMGRHHFAVAQDLGHEVKAIIEPTSMPSNTIIQPDWSNVQSADLAIIATPPSLHESAAQEAFDRGINVLIEKPLAPSPAACERIMKAADEAGVLAAVGHLERFNQAFLAYSPSSPVHVTTQRWSPLPTRIQDVGCMLDIGVHDIDLVRSMLGPVQLVGSNTGCNSAGIDTAVQAILKNQTSTASMDVNWNAHEQRRQITIMERRGNFTIDFLNKTITSIEGVVHYPDPEGETALHRQLLDVVQAIENGVAPTVGLAAGTAAVRLACQAIAHQL